MHSVARGYAQAIVQLAERVGLALPPPLLAALAGSTRVPLATQDALWEAFCSASGDALAGVRVGLALQAGHLDSAGLQLVTCDTLGQALAELAEIAPAIGEGGGFELQREGGLAHLSYRPHLVVRAHERVEAVLASALNLARWASGGRFVAAGVWFGHAPLAPPARYEALLGCPVHFGAARNSLGFDAAQCALPLAQANGPLRAHLRALTDRTLAELGRTGLGATVAALLREHPQWGRERVARELGLSARHLVRRLADEGASFKALRDAQLHELACRALAGPQRVADIAQTLGFSDEGAFVRAFRRWRGTTPARFRHGASAAAPGAPPPAPPAR